tara:strand:+ start:28 stop:297 length:270 start_codon:yes stop_codon:yes gene_type:complete
MKIRKSVLKEAVREVLNEGTTVSKQDYNSMNRGQDAGVMAIKHYKTALNNQKDSKLNSLLKQADAAMKKVEKYAFSKYTADENDDDDFF